MAEAALPLTGSRQRLPRLRLGRWAVAAATLSKLSTCI